MAKLLDGKNALVTGATRGIGRAIAKSLAAAGANVVICGRTADAVGQAVSELKGETGGRIAGQATDVRDREQVRALFALAAREFGGMDIVVNNAGIGLFAPLGEMAEESFREVIETNLTGVFHCCQEALVQFRNRGGGYLFQIGSLAGTHPFPGGAAYNASKFGLNGFAEAMMLDHRHDNVRVSTICPGSVDTEFGGPTGTRASWKIQPEDIAEIVLALLAMPERTLVSYVEVRPSKPLKK